jgi:hypothetical protein
VLSIMEYSGRGHRSMFSGAEKVTRRESAAAGDWNCRISPLLCYPSTSIYFQFSINNSTKVCDVLHMMLMLDILKTKGVFGTFINDRCLESYKT